MQKNSAWRPFEAATGQKMYMQVRHGFAAVGAVVDHNAEAGAEVQFFCQGLRRQQEMTEQSLVTGDGLIEARDKSLREDQHVHWRLRLDVVDGETQVILMDDLGGDLTVGDFLENGLHGGVASSE